MSILSRKIRLLLGQAVIAILNTDDSALIMAGKQAKLLSNTQAERLLDFTSASRNPSRNRVLALLSLKAGLRAGEISALSWPMILDPSGEIAPAIELRDHAAKKGSGRIVPVHPALRDALEVWRLETVGAGPVIKSERGGRMTPVSIVNWFALAFRALGFEGCSSHSGRRTFITRAARMVHRAGGSLRDVQLLAGHRSLVTTQRYIEGDNDAQRKLVSLI